MQVETGMRAPSARCCAHCRAPHTVGRHAPCMVELGVPQGPDRVRLADLHLAHLLEVGLIQEYELTG